MKYTLGSIRLTVFYRDDRAVIVGELGTLYIDTAYINGRITWSDITDWYDTSPTPFLFLSLSNNASKKMHRVQAYASHIAHDHITYICRSSPSSPHRP